MRRNRIADPNDSAGNDIGAQAAAANQAAQRAPRAQIFQVCAGIAQSYPAQSSFADDKFPADEMIQSHRASDDVAPRLRGLDIDAVVSLEGLKRFGFDQ